MSISSKFYVGQPLENNILTPDIYELFLYPYKQNSDYKNIEKSLLSDFLYSKLTEIFSLEIFKLSLIEVQNELAYISSLTLKTKKYHYHDIVRSACCFLGITFWETHSIFEKENIYLFKQIIWCICAQINEYGILTLPLYDDSISEILVNHAKTVYFEHNGLLSLSKIQFDSNNSLMTLIERICTAVGRKIDENTPYCDARLPDGSRIHTIIPPLSLSGPCLNIRKFPKTSINMEFLIKNSSVTNEISIFLEKIVRNKKNILISGGTGSGKTTFLNCLTSYIPHNERILTIEDSAELQLQQPHVVRLETRKENTEQKGCISIRDLVKNALRMRPDRIIVGECRGEEALDMLQAMNTGHDGSMTTIHSNSPQDALRRLETLVMFASQSLSSRAIREQISSAIHFVIQQSRLNCGKRCVTSIHEIISLCENSNQFVTKSIYEYSYA